MVLNYSLAGSLLQLCVTFSEGTCLSQTTATPSLPTDVQDNLANFLPGQMYDADAQCYIAGYIGACTAVSIDNPLILFQLQLQLSTLINNGSFSQWKRAAGGPAPWVVCGAGSSRPLSVGRSPL